ncbi:hypothetical protein RCL1_006679 [Eukaryota sp. TZLM3-RCL]
MSDASDLSDLDDFVDAVDDSLSPLLSATGPHIPVTTNKRMNVCDFNHLHQRQVIQINNTPVWTIKLGPCPKNPTLLACAGGDNNIYIYQVLPYDSQTSSSDIFNSSPVRILSGHTRPVICLYWRSDGLLISGSADKTARIWFIPKDDPSSAPEVPVSVLDHKEVVTSVLLPEAPCLKGGGDQCISDYAITGCLDQNVYVWDHADITKPIAFTHLKAMVTALDWLPSDESKTLLSSSPGEHLCAGQVAVGTHHAFCYLFEFQVLPRVVLVQRQLFQAVSSRGSNSKGHKVSSILICPGISRLFVATNDSRIRSYVYPSLKKSLKYIGHTTKSSHISCCVSRDGKYVLSGSENRKVFIWPLVSNHVPAINPRLNLFAKNDHHESFECFDVESNVTSALFAPSLLAPPIPLDYQVVTGDEARFVIVATEDGKVIVYDNFPQPREFVTPFAST